MRSFILLQFLLIITLAASETSGQSWQVIGKPGFSPTGQGEGAYQKIAVDRNNNLYIAYSFYEVAQGSQGRKGNVMKFSGKDWESVGDPDFTPGIAYYNDMALGQGDTIYYAFQDASAAGLSRAAVMMYDGIKWQSISNYLTSGDCRYTQVAYGNDGSVYFAAIDNGIANGGVVVKKYQGGTTWVDVGAAGTISPGGADYTSLDLDNSGVPYIAFQDKSASPGKVSVKKFDGTKWEALGAPFFSVDGPGTSPALDLDLEINHENIPYVAYSHGFQGPPRTSVQSFDGGKWVNVGTPQLVQGVTLYNDLTFAPDGTPYVIYQESNLGSKASVMKFDGTRWSNVGVAGFSGSISSFNSITIDHNGNVYVAFKDYNNGASRNMVMGFITCTTPVVDTVESRDLSICRGDTAVLTVSGQLNDATKWQWYAENCEGTLVDTGLTISVAPIETTTYYVRGAGGCIKSASCMKISLDVIHIKPTITQDNQLLTSSEVTGNQWYFNGEPIAGATEQQYNAEKTGWYYVVYTEGNCSGSSDSIHVEAKTNINIRKGGAHLVYPVPFEEQLNVALFDRKNGESYGLTITDLLGRIVYTQSNLKDKNVFQLNQLEAGYYILNLYSNAHRYSYKLIKGKQ